LSFKNYIVAGQDKNTQFEMRSTSASVRSFGTRSRAATAASGRKAALVPDRNVNISSRPLTAAAGIARGSSQSSSKPTGTRSVQDRTYFHTLLAGKVDDIEAEIQRLSEETEAIDANCSRQASRQQVYDSLLGETNKLEMTIADFNFAISKERSGADPEEIEALALGLKEHNDELANEVDNLFMKNQYSQNEVKRLENEMHSLRKSFESLLDNSDEDTIFEYERLTAKLKAIKDERIEVEGEVEALKGRMDEVRHTLSMRIDQDTCKRLDTEEENITALNTDLSAFEDKVRIAQMGEDDARLFFLDKIKTNKARLNELDKEHDDLHKELRELKKTEREHVDFLRDAESTGGLKNDKEMKMYSKVKDAQEYISLAKERIDSLQADNNAKQSMINDLEEDLSNRLISSKVEMPTQDKFQELNDTVNFRSKHLTSSQITMNRLSEQKDKRREEVSIRTGGRSHSYALIFVSRTRIFF
jgi:predicted  nucleic acid-binding Zn-ribbon protein